MAFVSTQCSCYYWLLWFVLSVVPLSLHSCLYISSFLSVLHCIRRIMLVTVIVDVIFDCCCCAIGSAYTISDYCTCNGLHHPDLTLSCLLLLLTSPISSLSWPSSSLCSYLPLWLLYSCSWLLLPPLWVLFPWEDGMCNAYSRVFLIHKCSL